MDAQLEQGQIDKEVVVVQLGQEVAQWRRISFVSPGLAARKISGILSLQESQERLKQGQKKGRDKSQGRNII